MVKVPELPGRVAEENTRPAHAVRLGEVFEALDLFNAEQLGEVYMWLTEHPLPGIDPVKSAMSSVNGLTQDELLLFFDQLHSSIDEQLWEQLTQ